MAIMVRFHRADSGSIPGIGIFLDAFTIIALGLFKIDLYSYRRFMLCLYRKFLSAEMYSLRKYMQCKDITLSVFFIG